MWAEQAPPGLGGGRSIPGLPNSGRCRTVVPDKDMEMMRLASGEPTVTTAAPCAHAAGTSTALQHRCGPAAVPAGRWAGNDGRQSAGDWRWPPRPPAPQLLAGCRVVAPGRGSAWPRGAGRCCQGHTGGSAGPAARAWLPKAAPVPKAGRHLRGVLLTARIAKTEPGGP